MKKTIAALILALPLSAFAAAATWSAVSTTDLCELPGRTWSNGNCRSVKAVCASGTCDAPTTSAQGMSLDSVGGFSVTVCADSGQTLSGAGTLQAYLYDDATALWARTPDLDLTVSSASVRCQSFAGFSVTAPRGRIAYVPASVTVSAGGVTATTLASGKGGQAL